MKFTRPLCSKCKLRPPRKANQRYCAPCHAAAEAARRERRSTVPHRTNPGLENLRCECPLCLAKGVAFAPPPP